MDYIKKAVEVLKGGGVILYPTDTLYGLGGDATRDDVVERIYELKGRSEEKPMLIACSDIGMVKKYAKLDKSEEEIVNKFLPGPYSFLMRNKGKISENVAKGLPSVGVRIPDHETTLKLIDAFGKPIISTSANLTGEDNIESLSDLKFEVDCILPGECKHFKSSTVVDLESRKVLRCGVGCEDIKKYFELL